MIEQRPSRTDLLVAAAVLVVAVVEVTLNGEISPTAAALPCEIALAVVLLWRRVAPLAVVGVVAIVQVVEAAAGVPLEQPVVPLLASVIAIYALITCADTVHAAVGAVIGLAAVGIETLLQHKGFGNFAFAAVFIGGAILVGRTVAHRTQQTVHLQHKADTLERNAEASARAAAEAAQVERARIARELHDVIAHSLSVMVVQAGAAEQVMARDADRARAAIAAVQATGRDALAEMAHLVGMLREDSGELGLAPQPGLADVSQLVDQARCDGLGVELHVEGEERPLPPGPALSLYRVVQESLTNVRKHAAGAQASVRLTYSARGIDADVCDTGPAQHTGNGLPSGGHGLIGMRERVALYGGTLAVGSHPDGG
ncbi:MAG: sensor histidine kinase, partial [Jatrophihabitans sp.]